MVKIPSYCSSLVHLFDNNHDKDTKEAHRIKPSRHYSESIF